MSVMVDESPSQAMSSAGDPSHGDKPQEGEQIHSQTASEEIADVRTAKEEDLKESPPASQPKKDEDEPYSIFTGGQKWTVVLLATLGGFVSPISAAIYLPALPAIASDLDQSMEAIALTVTVYMIFQGLTPMFLGSLSDTLGRRPILMACFVVWMGANIGMANLPDSYAGLMVLRCLQALGSSSAISISAGIVADITTIAVRGSVMGIVQCGNLVGPSLGPLIGGALAQGFGWRAIFWFLFCVGALTLAATAFFLPETLRKLVGNGGQLAPTVVHETVWNLVRGKTVAQRTGERRPGMPRNGSKDGLRTRAQRMRYSFLALFAPLRLLAHLEITLCLILNAVPYTAFFMLTTTLSSLYTSTYGLSTLQVGLVFLASGFGTLIAAFSTGRLLDYHYRVEKAACLARKRAELEARGGGGGGDKTAENEHDDATPSPSPSPSVLLDPTLFPLERARLRSYPAHLLLLLASILAYGWTIDRRVHLAAPTVFSFFAGYASGALVSIFSTMIVDFATGRSASVTSLNNLFRCLLGAGGTAVAQPIVNRLSAGWAFTLVAFFNLLPIPFAIVLLRYGPGWRKDRKKN